MTETRPLSQQVGHPQAGLTSAHALLTSQGYLEPIVYRGLVGSWGGGRRCQQRCTCCTSSSPHGLAASVPTSSLWSCTRTGQTRSALHSVALVCVWRRVCTEITWETCQMLHNHNQQLKSFPATLVEVEERSKHKHPLEATFWKPNLSISYPARWHAVCKLDADSEQVHP